MNTTHPRLVSGVVSDLSVLSGEQEFARSAGQQAAGVATAAGLAAAGLAGAAVGTSIAATAGGDSVEFFSCKIDGRLIDGCFSKASFKNGDHLDVVLAHDGYRAPVLAARRAADRVLWVIPHHFRGVAAHRARMFRLCRTLSLSLPLFFFSSYLILGVWVQDSPTSIGLVQFMGYLSLGLGVIGAIYYSVRFYFQWLPVARHAEAIFAALGYRDPSRVDLQKDHKRYCKARGIKWPYLSDGPWIYHYIDPKREP